MFKLRDLFNDMALSNEAQARRLCDKLCTALPDQPRLKTIASVGAFDAEIGADMVDSKRLTGVMSYLLRSGFLIDPDFTIDAVNFVKKRDFLKEDNQADLVFVSFILERQQYGTVVYDERMAEIAEQANSPRSYFGVALSRLHRAEIWRNRIESAGAQMVVTYGGRDEIGTHTLCDRNNQDKILPLIGTPSQRIAQYAVWKGKEPDLESRADLKTLYNNAANDLPMPWLGFAARPDYLKAVAPGLSQDTVLGQRAKAEALILSR